jgi:hypothetical protein
MRRHNCCVTPVGWCSYSRYVGAVSYHATRLLLSFTVRFCRHVLAQVLRLSQSRHLPPVAVDSMFSCFASVFTIVPESSEIDIAIAPLRDVLSTMLLVHFMSATRTSGGNTPRRVDVPSSAFVDVTGQPSRIGTCLELYRLLCARDPEAAGYAAACEGGAAFSHYLGSALDTVCSAEFKTLSPAEWDVVARAMQSCVVGGRNCV